MPVAKPATYPRWADDAVANGNAIWAPILAKQKAGWAVDEYPPAEMFNWFFNLVYLWMLYLGDIENQSLTWNGATTFHANVTFDGASVATFTAQPVFSAGITVGTNITNHSAGTFTGNGTGPGVSAVGGSTSGAGATYTGGAPNGYGLVVLGVGDGRGISVTSGVTGAGAGAYVVGFGKGVESYSVGTGAAVYARGGSASIAGAGTGPGIDAASQDGFGGVFTGNATRAPIQIVQQAVAPTNTTIGSVYLDSVYGILRVRSAFASWDQASFPVSAAAPATVYEGLMYYDTVAHKLKIRTAGAWETVTSA